MGFWGKVNEVTDRLTSKLPAGIGEEKVGVISNPDWDPGAVRHTSAQQQGADTGGQPVVSESAQQQNQVNLPERKKFIILREEEDVFDLGGFTGEHDAGFTEWVESGGVDPENDDLIIPAAQETVEEGTGDGEPQVPLTPGDEENSVGDPTEEGAGEVDPSPHPVEVLEEHGGDKEVEPLPLAAVPSLVEEETSTDEETPAPDTPEGPVPDTEEYTIGENITLAQEYGPEYTKIPEQLTSITNPAGETVGYTKESVDHVMRVLGPAAALTTAGHERSIADFYNYSIVFSPEKQLFIGSVAEFPSLIVEEQTYAAACLKIHEAASDAIIRLSADREPPPAPFGVAGKAEFFSSVRTGFGSVNSKRP